MPNPKEICEVRAGGQKYDIWETVEVHHNTMQVVDHCFLTVAEKSSAAKLASIKLKPGDPAEVYLAGTQVINGHVFLRQGFADATSHQVQIGIASMVQNIIPSTVEAKPGIYKKQPIDKIVNAVWGKYKVPFKIVGNPPGANLPFDRVIEQVGETCFAFAERLCRLRNLHMIDDSKGGIEAFRGPQGRAAPLQEGRNMKRGRILLSNNEQVESLTGVAQTPRQHSADASRDISAMAKVPLWFGATGMPERLMKFVTEDAVDKSSVAMRVNHQVDRTVFDEVDGTITVPGWFDDSGQLWFFHVRKLVDVYAPLLLPTDQKRFMIKGVIHRQTNEGGTETDVQLCREDGLGGSGEALVGPSDTVQ